MSTGGDGTVCFWKWDIFTFKFEYVVVPLYSMMWNFIVP